MADGLLVRALRKDRLLIAAALAAITMLAWGHVLWIGAAMDMGGAVAPMSGMAMPAGAPAEQLSLAPRFGHWSAGEAAFMFAMWAVMMVAMMTPSAAPMVLLYAAVGRRAAADGKAFASSAWFAAGYLISWTTFALLATVAQWALERAALLTPAMATASPEIGGLVLIAAGLYQWTPLKAACLKQCQSPLNFIQRHGGFRRDARGAVLLGLRHGGYCIGCCWALMALLFVGGIMNILWIAGLAIFVLAEKVLRMEPYLPRAAGALLIIAGIVLAV